MTKWADYLIYSVRFNLHHTHIDKVRFYTDEGDSIGKTSYEYTRPEIIAAIRRGTTFSTIIKNSEGKWDKGQPVYIIHVNGVDYIKSVSNSKEADNLDELPEF